MDKYDASQLTEFPRFEEETSQSGVSSFFNKLWKIPIFSPSESGESSQNKAIEDSKTPVSESESQEKQEYEESKPETGAYAVEFEGRSLPNVLKRISSLVALGSGGGTRYADTELARYWMPDDISRECYECAMRFSALRRRHHCRVCGQIFCSRCCSQRVPGHIFGCAGGLRVCNYCCNVVLSYLRENDANGEMSTDLRTLQENLQVKFPDNKSQVAKSRDNFMLSRDQEERCDARPSPKETIQDVFRQLSFALPTQQHRYRLVRYNGVWRGCDILQWVMDNTSHKTRAQATLVCQNLLNSGYMECMVELPHFADYALYKPLAVVPQTNEDSPAEEHSRLVESVSSYCLDLNLGDNSARLIKASKKVSVSESKSSPSSEEETPSMDNSEGETESKKVCKAIAESGEDHLKLLMRQCLARESLSATWTDILYPLCQQAAEIVMPDLYGNEIDARNYVQVKKVPGGNPRDCAVAPAVAICKNVVHRGMPQEITNPTVLILDCSIAYQRVEGKLTSLEPVLMQEREYLVRCAARITALRPSVVLVRGGCARPVQDALRQAGVALATTVRPRSCRRVARSTRAEIVTSIDARIGTPRLGTCKNFYIKNYESKTLMFFEDCAEPQLGCCILLRGAPLQELVKVKKVVKFMILACYNWKLEKAFLGDIEALLPEPGMTFDDDTNDASDVFNTEITKNSDDTKSFNENNDEGENDETSDKTKDETSDDVFKTIEDNTIPMKENKKPEVKDTASNENNQNNDKNQEIGDPLHKSKVFRKTDSDKTLSCGVPIRDFSDPLRSTLSSEDEVFLPKEEAKLKADDTHGNRWSTDDAVLSMSPNVVVPAPGAGRWWRPPPRAPHTPRPPRARAPPPPSRLVKEVHPFISRPITAPADDPAFRALLADFRATGCRLDDHRHSPGCPLYKPSVIRKVVKEPQPEPEKTEKEYLDPLAPENHQRLSVLLYSFSNKSANVPDFCVNPWIATMEMYGQRDISLGSFLEKYCFNGEYKCTSNTCQVPMNQHVRKFVHGDVCITITCNTVGHSNVDKIKEEQSKQVMFWSRCEQCGGVGRATRLSRAALGLSLATYVRLRCLGSRYVRARVCPHPLHAHAHAFVSRLTTACFRFSKIQTYDIELPPEVIHTKYDTKQMRDALLAQLNDLVPKGYETFSGVSDPEAEKEYQAFRNHVEQINLALTSARLQEHASLAAVVRSLWNVSDRIIAAEKMLRDAHEKWSTPAAKAAKNQPENNAEEKSDVEDSSENTDASTTYVFEGSTKEMEKEHGEEDEERGDKKTVRQILSQLLSNSSSSSQQNGIIISTGLIPVVVLAGEIGSVIAATLASVTYQKSLRSHSQPDHEEERDRDKEGKKGNEHHHIEVLLKDGLLCRVYYATQFHRLRHLLLAPLESNPHIEDSFASQPGDVTTHRCCEDTAKMDNKGLCDVEEGFIRSLAFCVPWAAKGGKSGSTFCKTKDDRYVLKEMTKPEWQQFLEFAPHYFNYVTNCHHDKQPSLLARILGVYSVGGAGNGVLVMENIWYGCGPDVKRFDLKGSSRHRLTADTQPLAVLMDENLLNLRWERQLYITGDTARELFASVERDTRLLAANSVMDYSLLLGLRPRSLALGLIDYIRTFTWDKKLEHLVKKNLGSGQPTVVSPAEYRRRFTLALRKYFLPAVAHWDHLLEPSLITPHQP